MTLSEAIRRGHTMIGESHIFFYKNGGPTPCGCALGAAWVALGHTETVSAYPSGNGEVSEKDAERIIAEECGLPKEVTREVSRRHCVNQIDRLSLADWVEREYESKIPQKVRESDKDYTARIIAEIKAGATTSLPAISVNG